MKNKTSLYLQNNQNKNSFIKNSKNMQKKKKFVFIYFFCLLNSYKFIGYGWHFPN